MRVPDQTTIDQSNQTEWGPSLSTRADCTNNFHQPYEKIHSQISTALASFGVTGRPPPHPFDNDFVTSYRTSAIFSHRQVDTLPNNSKWPRSRECEPDPGGGRPWASIQAVAGQANCGQSGETQNRRRTEKNNKICTTRSRRTPGLELDAANRSQTAWTDDRKRWNNFGN